MLVFHLFLFLIIDLVILVFSDSSANRCSTIDPYIMQVMKKIAASLCFLGVLVLILSCMPSINMTTIIREEIIGKNLSRTCTKCESMVPCTYKDEVTLRIIVITYDRKDSLKKCLDALQNADIIGVDAALEIWIDISKDGKVNRGVLDLAKSFQWRHGRTCVHVQTKHVNVAFQWIYSWRPRPGSKEIGVFIEDDVDVSKYFFRYLKAARDFYANNKEINGICLNDENCQISRGAKSGHPLVRPTAKSDIVYLYGLFCTWGYAPYPTHWRAFQDWYHNNVSHNSNYDPTAKEAALQSSWYRSFKMQKKTDTMLHEMYLIRYSIDHKLYTLHPNLQVLQPRPHSGLTTNRKEKGLHFGGNKGIEDHRLTVWKEDFVKFPKSPKKYGWNGALL